MVTYNGRHIVLEIPIHRILVDIRNNQKIILTSGIVPKNLNQVLLALIESWVSIDPAKRADLLNLTLDSNSEDNSAYVKSYSLNDKEVDDLINSPISDEKATFYEYPLTDEQVIADFQKQQKAATDKPAIDFNKMKSEVEKLFADKDELKRGRRYK